MSLTELEQEMAELSSAEEFLDYFGVSYEARVVQVNRLHILQRFHDYLSQRAGAVPAQESEQRTLYHALLRRAYDDFVHSDAQTERVFKVFQSGATATVPLSAIGRAESHAPAV